MPTFGPSGGGYLDEHVARPIPRVSGEPEQWGRDVNPMRLRGTVVTQRVCRITFDARGEFAAWTDRIGALVADPLLFARLLRAATAETLVKAIRERFIRGLPNALEMEVVTAGTKVRRRDTEAMKRFAAAYGALSEAQVSGDPDRIRAARDRLDALYDTFVSSLNETPTGRQYQPSSLSSGKFRPYALQVLNRLTNIGHLQIRTIDGGVSLHMGSLSDLSKIRTPSATEHVLGRGRSKSPYQTLWRHLEFGTGVYATDPVGAGHAPGRAQSPETGALATGYWYYSKHPPDGMILRGSKGIHALKQATGIYHSEDLIRFPARIAMAFNRAFTGRVTLTQH